MTDDESGWSTKTEVAVYLVIIAILLMPAVYAIAFDATSEAGAEWEATPSGPTVYFDEDRSLASSGAGYDPYPGSNAVNITTSAGIAVYSGTADTRARIDTVDDGTWSNVSQLDVTAGNLTINPDTLAKASIKGDASAFKFKGQAAVNDGQVDAIITGNGQTTITMETDGAADTNYGLVDVSTDEALAVDVADTNGQVVFDDVDLSGTEEVRVEELGSLTIREETPQHELITGADVTIRFFEEDGETVRETSDSDGDGKIDLTGLPVDEQFIAQVDAPQHEQRTVLISDLSQQETIFLLNDSATPGGVQKEFIVNDQTGNFDGEETEIVIERAINESYYKTDGIFEYRTIAGDDVGADRAYIVTLQEDTRYRISVRNDNGDVRQLGAFTPKVAGTTNLDIGSVTAQQTNVEGVAWNASITNTTSGDEVVVGYNDSLDKTDTLYIEVHERGNRSNKLISNTTYTGPLGEVSVSQPIPAAENMTEWKVRITAERSEGEDFSATKILSPRRNVLPGLPGWFTAIASLGLIWITAGLFSQVNGDVGALVVAGMGAMFWFVGFAPGALGVGVVILSMVTAGLIFVNERRDGGL
jgi:hypothetical protein